MLCPIRCDKMCLKEFMSKRLLCSKVFGLFPDPLQSALKQNTERSWSCGTSVWMCINGEFSQLFKVCPLIYNIYSIYLFKIQGLLHCLFCSIYWTHTGLKYPYSGLVWTSTEPVVPSEVHATVFKYQKSEAMERGPANENTSHYWKNWWSDMFTVERLWKVWKSDFITAEELRIKYLITQLWWIIDAFTITYHGYHSCLQVLVDYVVKSRVLLFFLFYFFLHDIRFSEWLIQNERQSFPPCRLTL